MGGDSHVTTAGPGSGHRLSILSTELELRRGDQLCGDAWARATSYGRSFPGSWQTLLLSQTRETQQGRQNGCVGASPGSQPRCAPVFALGQQL